PAVETWPNLVSNNEWSLTREYARFNPLSPRFLVQVARLGRMLKAGQGMDVASFMSGARASLRLVTIPRAFQYAGETFTDGYMFVGPGLTDRSFQGAWAPPKEVPVVLMSLGTAYNDRPDLYRLVLASAAGRPWHVVMAIGKIDPGTLGPIPPNVEVHAHVPQLEVLRHAGAFVTHAGMGSIMESLHARVPLIALPQMAEQRANADRLVELGLGTSLDPEHVTADVLWDAIAQAESDAHVRDQLDWMAREIKAAGGASAAADAVERLLGRNSLDPPV
ncbi:nucleotide disphospho-sugar-binding domain-containing protein, partial [Pseudactinotalea sp.]|uniref:nucleotide disphospho-sugar-binding domain-containing protein n=1 Tax=Pseudactinotalea sp. TaxID=1926260 RepID=UPI003B3ADD32